jgi:hypothetical protein
MSPTATRYRIRTTGVAWRQTGDEGVVLDVEKSEYFGLSRSATLLWPLLEKGATRDELVAQLMSGPTVSLQRAQTDVDAFLLALSSRQLVSHDSPIHDAGTGRRRIS